MEKESEQLKVLTKVENELETYFVVLGNRISCLEKIIARDADNLAADMDSLSINVRNKILNDLGEVQGRGLSIDTRVAQLATLRVVRKDIAEILGVPNGKDGDTV